MSDEITLMSYVKLDPNEDSALSDRLDIFILIAISEKIYQAGLSLETNKKWLKEYGEQLPDLRDEYLERVDFWNATIDRYKRSYEMVKAMATQHANAMYDNV